MLFAVRINAKSDFTGPMKKYYLTTFGCQMNVHDSEKMAGILKAEGLLEAAGPDDADIIIFNTCSIRQKAEQKFYSELGRLKALKKIKPDLKIAVSGCIAQQEGKKMLKRTPYVDYIMGPQNIHLLKNIFKSKPARVSVEDNPLMADMEFPVDRRDNLKAWVNIMYGCNNFCSYCIVPYTRGREKSRAKDSIINEIRSLAESGCKEVTLLGQNVNSYRSSVDFPGLLKEINNISGIKRIRFMTSHPKDLTEDLVYAISDLDKVCEHIHLPLQSGSTKVLGLMNRKYSYADYLRGVDRLREEIPEIAITSDIIAGFPQETEEDHECTIKALKDIQFDGLFAFMYSARPGTRAAAIDGHIPENIQSQRLAEILELQNDITNLKNKELEGTVQEILIEKEYPENSDNLIGRTRANKIIPIPWSSNINPGDIVKVKIIKAHLHSLEAEVISEG